MKRLLRQLPILPTLCLLLAALAGCVERQMTITTEPAGVHVTVSGVDVGRTPVTIPFTWYGDYEFILRQEGMKTRVADAKILPPAYEIPPIDLLSELAPWTYKDQRFVHFKLEPLTPSSESQLLKNADELRDKALEPVKHSTSRPN